jgi:uncharacterized small protein (DUF1192 family)
MQERGRAFRAEGAELIRRSRMLEEEIDAAEAELGAIASLFADPAYFAATAPQDVKATDTRKKELEQRLGLLYDEWETVSTELEALRAKHGVPT